MHLNLGILIVEAMSIYLLVLWAHSLRHRFGLAPFYTILGGLTAIMSWVTDAGAVVHFAGITFVVGSTVFYTALLLGVFVVYIFDGPRATRVAILTVAGVSALMPLIAVVLHFQMQLSDAAPLGFVPMPSLRINTASVLATIADLFFLAIAWEFLGHPRARLHLGLRAFVTLLGVMWLDVLLFATGAFAGTPAYLSIMKGTFISRFIIALFASPFLYAYLRHERRKPGVTMEKRPVLAILREMAEVKSDLTIAQREIERRKRIEADLQKKEALLNEVGRIARIGGWEMDVETGKATWTEGTYDIVEIERGEPVPGLHEHTSFYLPQYREEIEKAMRALIEEDVPLEFEAELKTAKGRIKWCRALGRAERKDGTCVRVYGTFQDITESKQIAGELQRSERLLQKIFDTLPIGLWFADKTGKLLMGNKAGVEIWGAEPLVPQEEYGVFRAWRLPSGEEIAPDDWALAHSVNEGTTTLDEKLEIEAFDGKRKIILNSTAPVFDDEGRIQGAVVINRDITKQYKLEESLRRSEERLSRAQAIAHVGSWEFDLNTNLVYASDECRRTYGLESHEWTIKEVQRIPLAEYRDKLDAALKALVEEDKPYNIEFRIQRPSDNAIIDIHSIAVFDRERNVVAGTIQDITERKRAQRELAESKAFVDTIMNGIADPIFVKDEDHRWTALNDAACAFFGHPREEMLGKSDYDFFPAEQADVFWAHDERVMESGEVDINVETIASADGDRIISTIKSPFNNPVTGKRNLVGTIRDITDIRETQQRLEAIIDHSREMFYIHDINDALIFVTPQSMDFFGYTPEELMCKWTDMLTDNPLNQRGIELTQKAVETGERQEPYELELKRKDGGTIWVEVDESPLENAQGEIIGLVGNLRNITAEKSMKQALNESEKRYRQLVEGLNEGIWEIDADGRTTFVNPRMADMMGYTVDEMKDMHLLTFMDEEWAEVAKKNMEARRRGEGAQHEFTFLRKDGSELQAYLSTTPLLDEEDNFIGALAGVSDIGPLKTAEKALKASEQRVRSKLKAILEPEGDIGSLNIGDILDTEAIQAMMDDFYALTHIGVTIEDRQGNLLISTGWQDICTKFHRVHPETNKRCLESDTVLASADLEPGTFKRYKCKNNMWDIVTPIMLGDRHAGNLFLGQFMFVDEEPDYDFFRKQAKEFGFDEKEYLAALDRVPRWTHETIEQVMDFYSRIASLLSELSYSNVKLARALTQRETAEEALRKSEEQYRLLADNTVDCIWAMSLDQRFTYVNPAVKYLFGYTAEEWMGTPLKDHALPDDYADMVEQIERAARDRNPLGIVFESGILHRDGRRIPVEITGKMLFDETSGQPIALQGITRDITERKRVQELRIAKETAEKASEAKSDFLAMVSHELRTPLNTIIGFSEAMQDGIYGDLSERQLHTLENIVGSGHLLHTLTNDLLDLSRVEAGKLDLVATRINIPELIGQTISMAEREAKEKAIEVESNVSDEAADLDMVADGKRLKQVIGNLLHNACKFTPENGRITLSVNVTEEDAGRCLQVSVADTGAGIAEEDQDRIFDRFQQVDSSYARSHGGLGLGLALVRKLVELHGGRVWVESPSPDLKPEEEGPGSKFVFVIPVDFLDETDLII